METSEIAESAIPDVPTAPAATSIACGAALTPAEADENASVATLIKARDAWSQNDPATASSLLEQARSEGIDSTWFSEEAALLAYDLGALARSFPPDPPYPNRLGFIAVWELSSPRSAR